MAIEFAVRGNTKPIMNAPSSTILFVPARLLVSVTRRAIDLEIGAYHFKALIVG
jgi:hypothetical protein